MANSLPVLLPMHFLQASSPARLILITFMIITIIKIQYVYIAPFIQKVTKILFTNSVEWEINISFCRETENNLGQMRLLASFSKHF